MDPKIKVKPLVGAGDWPLWKYKLQFVLKSQSGALDVVEGKHEAPLPLPTSPAPKDEEVRTCKAAMASYEKANVAAMTILTNSLTDDTLRKVMRFTDARKVWLELCTLFEPASETQLFDLFGLVQDEEENIVAYLSKVKNLWTDINQGLEKIKESPLPDLFLMGRIVSGLTGEFRGFRSMWTILSQDKKTIDELTTQLCSFEREAKLDHQKAGGNEGVNQEALLAKKTTTTKQQQYSCHYCGKRGHWIRSCHKWISDGRPPKSTGKPSGQSTRKPPGQPLKTSSCSCAVASEGLVCLDQEVFAIETKTTDWFIDNGASKHVCRDRSLFISYKDFVKPHGIVAADGLVVPAIGSGLIKIAARVNGKDQIKMLHDVWFVPKINKNLFSVLSAQDSVALLYLAPLTTSCYVVKRC